MFLSFQPQHKAADICSALAAGSFTVSFTTVVDAVQLIAGLIAIVSGALSFYFRFFHKPKRRTRRSRR
jgi:hypothetical protein